MWLKLTVKQITQELINAVFFVYKTGCVIYAVTDLLDMHKIYGINHRLCELWCLLGVLAWFRMVLLLQDF